MTRQQPFDAMRSAAAAILQTVIDEEITTHGTTSRRGATAEAARRAAKQMSSVAIADALLVVMEQEFDKIDTRESQAAHGQRDYNLEPAGWFKDGEGGRKPKRLCLLADWEQQRRLTIQNRQRVVAADDAENDEFLDLLPHLAAGLRTDEAYARLRP